jgi:hypothetical protein
MHKNKRISSLGSASLRLKRVASFGYVLFQRSHPERQWPERESIHPARIILRRRGQRRKIEKAFEQF